MQRKPAKRQRRTDSETKGEKKESQEQIVKPTEELKELPNGFKVLYLHDTNLKEGVVRAIYFKPDPLKSHNNNHNNNNNNHNNNDNNDDNNNNNNDDDNNDQSEAPKSV